jgi:phage/plasmid-like protein (TIGR03299 family)
MFYVGETPWHGLGVQLESAPTTREAIVAAGLDWEVGQKELWTVQSNPDVFDSNLYADQKVPALANYRTTDGRILGVVGPGTHPLQNRDAFAFFDPFLASGDAVLETAGSLRDGERIWALARINRDPSVVVPGDEVLKYLLLSNSHDGKVAVRVGFTPIRVVCANTLALAHGAGDAHKTLLKLHHTRKVKEAVVAARDAINLADRTFEATAERYRFLASRQIDRPSLELLVRRVLSPAPGQELPGASKITLPKVVRTEKALERLVEKLNEAGVSDIRTREADV